MRRLVAATTFTLGLVVAPTTARSQAKPAMHPIATLPGVSMYDFVVMPNGRVMYYAVED